MTTGRAFAWFVSLLAVCAAIFGAYFGWVVYALAESADSNYDGTVSTAVTVQFILGWVGIAPAVAMSYFVYKGRDRRAVTALIVGLVIWAGWGLILDVGDHGWRDSYLLSLF